MGLDLYGGSGKQCANSVLPNECITEPENLRQLTGVMSLDMCQKGRREWFAIRWDLASKPICRPLYISHNQIVVLYSVVVSV